MGLLDPPDHPIRTERSSRVNTSLLVEPRFLSDQLGGEQPVHLIPGSGDLGRDGLAEHLTDRSEEVVPDDGVLLRPDTERDVLEGDPPHHMGEGRRLRIDQLHCVGDHRGSQRPALFPGRLVALVEDPQQFGMLCEHSRIEPCGDLLGVLRHHRRCRLHHHLRTGGQQCRRLVH